MSAPDRQRLVAALNELLEAERAGVEALADLVRGTPKGYLRNELEKIGRDESWSCAGLHRAIVKYGGEPSRQAGDFAAKLRAATTAPEKFRLLSRGQSWVVKRLDALLAMDLDRETRRFLAEMRQEHLDNIAWCDKRAQLADPGSA